MKNKIKFTDVFGSDEYKVTESFEEEYNLYGAGGDYLGHTEKQNGFYSFVEISGNARKQNQHFISYVLNTLNNCLYIPKDYYVYMVFVDKSLRYIGKGNGGRFTHSVSGTSHVYELNRAYFENSIMEVFCYAEGLSEQNALNLESGLIARYGCYEAKNLYNSRGISSKSCADIDWDDEILYLEVKQKWPIAVKVGLDEEYEFLEDYQENFKFENTKERHHGFISR